MLLLLACHTVGVARACSRDFDSGLRRCAPSVLVGGAPYASCRVAPGAAPLGPLWPPAGSAVRHGSCGDACLALGASAPATLSSAGGFCRGKQRLFGAGLGPPGGSTTSHVESSWDLVGQNVDSRLLVFGVNRDVSAAKAPYRHPRGTSDRLAVNVMSPRLASLWALLVSMAWDPRYALVIPDKGAATSSVAALVAALTMVLVALAITLMQALGLDVARLVMAVAGASVQTPPSALTALTSSRSMPLQLWCRVSTIPPWDMLDAGTGTPP